MKASLTFIAIALLVASCATQSAQPPGTAATPTADLVKAKPKAAPEPKPYPLETCLASNEDLDEMDERVATVHEGQTFEFCCKPCLVKFRKDPEKYVAKLAAETRR